MYKRMIYSWAMLILCLPALLATSPVYAASKQKAGQKKTSYQSKASRKPQAKKPAPARQVIRKPGSTRASVNFSKFHKHSAQKRKGYQPAPLPKITFSETLEMVSPDILHQKGIQLPGLPAFSSVRNGMMAATSPGEDTLYFTLDPSLQAYAQALSKSSRLNHISMVVMEPQTGKILAMAGSSSSLTDVLRHPGFPAASLFKLVTTTAALEKGAINPSSSIDFRGGNYTLNQYNYKPSPKADTRHMNVSEALGKSCNPVFARLALNYLSTDTISRYTQAFGFNAPLPFDTSLPVSSANIPTDEYGLGRTAAGFGDVYLSPIHAAAMMAGIANQGLMPRPYFVDHVTSSTGQMIYQARPQAVRRLMRTDTANTLMKMMISTTTTGTSRRAFAAGGHMGLSDMAVEGKTGTLDGTNPPGLNNWFIAAAPVGNPRVAVAVNVVNPAGVPKQASRLGRQLIEKFFHRI